MNAITVFISYSHDSDEHRKQVLALSERLRKDGIETLLDQYVNGAPKEGWPRWMMNQLDAADYVLVVCTETYYRRFRGHEVAGKGKGVDWEGALITSDLYAAHSHSLKFVPVFLSSVDEDYIPEPLRSGNHYALASESDYQRLYDFLLQQAGVEPGPVGAPKIRARQGGTALTFDASASAARPTDISRIMKYAPSNLIGREAETRVLNDAWDQVVRGETKRPHILTFVALGGEGKTSVVAKWAVDLAFQDWPGCEGVLAWSFYSQGTREQLAASSDLFLNEGLTFFGDAAMAGSAAGAFDKGRRLAQLAGERRALLILDGLEPLQYAPTSPTAGELKDQGIAALLKGLATNSRGLCVVTTRYSIPDLRAYVGKTVAEKKLARLSTEAGVALLQSFEVKGSLRKTIPSSDGRTVWNEFEKLVEDVKGHALTLNLLGSYLRDAHGGDIRKRDLIRLSEADAEEQGGHAFHVMDAYVESLANGGSTADDQAKGRRALALLRLLGLFDRPATSGTLAALWEGEAITGLTEPIIGISEVQRNVALQRLEDAKLLTVVREPGSAALVALDAHPLLREYFGQRLREAQPEAWRAAHRRLFEHLCTTTEDKPDATLEDLQPLYQAVAHGCHAGLQQEACEKVYRDRILRGDQFLSTRKLGAFGSDLGAVACFFETPWSRVSAALTEADQSWLLNQAAFRLRALGRLTEALKPMQSGLEMGVKQENWKEAAVRASNVSELELTLGDVAGAVGDAEESVTYADRSTDAFRSMAFRTTHADALHQAGRRDEAEARFREAEEMQTERQSDYPLLYSLWGFRYCDMLLAEVEREAAKAEGDLKTDDGLALCRAVAERATQTLKWLTDANVDLLSIALDHLTLGRAALYAAILESRSRQHEPAQTSPPPTSKKSQRGFTPAATEMDHAVSGLRRAGQQDDLPRGLLTRAWLRSLTGAHTGPGSAQSDLDEAWEIAERGPMPLFQADIHLYRARLFFDEAKYPWNKNPDGTTRGPKDDLAAARVIIEHCGYWRRKEELADAEAAAKSWPDPMPPAAEGRNVMRKTIVELDLKGYSDVARELEENLSAEVVMHFNDQIQTFVDTGLSAVSLHRQDAVMATTGDGAILALDSPSVAHRYALAVHNACRLHNHKKTVASAKRWFRVGIATGDLAIETNAGVKRMAGSVIARAVRLETASNVGEILVDTETYAGLSDEQKSLYDPEETIRGKRDEVFAAHRCVAIPGIGVAPTPPPKARSVAAKPSAALARWRDKLEYFQEQLAIVTSPGQKFELKCQIDEAKQMIEELGG